MSSASIVISSSLAGRPLAAKQPHGVPQPCAIDRVAGAAPVREPRPAHAALEILAERILRRR